MTRANLNIYQLLGSMGGPKLLLLCQMSMMSELLQCDDAPKLRRCCCCARLDDPGYSAPLYLRVPTLVLFLLSGFAVSYVLSASLGDNTWGVSTGTRVARSIVLCAIAQHPLPCSVARSVTLLSCEKHCSLLA